MSRSTDQVLARYVAEIEERQNFIDGLVESSNGDDLTDEKMELVTRAKDRIAEINRQMAPLEEARRISGDSAERIRQIAEYMSDKPQQPTEIEYRSAGEYVLDYWKAGLGADEAAMHRVKLYNRAAAHQTTSDNAGLLPAPILGNVLNFIDAARPVVAALGPRQIPGTGFGRPKVTQHTAVAAQSAEKAELTSQKMTITKLTVTPVTYGGYVNVSRQDIDWTQPQVMDIVITDLAAQYAIKTEAVAVQAFYTGATAGTVTIPATPTADNVAAAFWGAAAQVYNGVKGTGRLIAAASPDVLGILGGLFAPVNPVDSQSSGFTASTFGQGAMGSIGGIPVYVTSGFAAAKSLLVMSTSAAEVYEDRIGSLQVVEPSVLGVQVAYAGYFAPLLTEATGIIKVTVT
jgi:HK97 family phage major capsid protein